MEKWLKISSHPKYSVSNQGRVRNDESKKIRTLSLDGKGYARVRIDGKTCKVHRLVAEAFVANLDCKPEVNHIDGNKTNNNSKNLEWVTHSENQLHACHKLGKVRGTAHMQKMAENSYKKRRKPILCIETGVIYEGLRVAGRITGISRENIGAALHGRQATAGGYHWKFAEVN